MYKYFFKVMKFLLLLLYVCKRETRIDIYLENSALTVVTWSCVAVENDGGVCLSHIIWAWAQLASKQTPPKMAFPKTYCLGANELCPE